MSDYIPQYPIYINQHLDIICLQGSFSFESGEVNHICGPHSLTVIVKDSFCKFTSFSEDLKIAVLTSDTNDFQMGASTLGSLVLFQHYVKESPNFPLTKDEMDYVMGVYNTIKRLPSINDCQYINAICQAQHTSLFYLLFGKVRNIIQNHKAEKSLKKSVSHTFMSNVGEHFREERQLEYYADLQCISSKYLSFAVKKECGIPAHQIIADYVMIEAKALLARDDLSILDVSEILHFQNQSFFGKFFKVHEGMSPSQYRESIR